MSLESATRFLEAAAHDEELRERFTNVHCPEDFLDVIGKLGYCFTTAELLVVAKEQSKGVDVRRKTGVWYWLRQLNWVDKSKLDQNVLMELEARVEAQLESHV